MNVSLIIPAYNAARSIGGLLESVSGLQPPPLEVILVDDCSTDNTTAIAGGFDNITCLKTPRNSGPSAARNLGARMARGELLMFIDSDCVMLTTNCIDQHARIHQKHPGCVLTGAVKSLTTNTITGRAAAYYEWHEMIPCHTDPEMRPAARLGSAHCSLSKATFDCIGGFDESIRAGEDTAFHHDAVKKGFRTFIRHDIVIGHVDITDPRRLMKKLFNYGKTRVAMKRRGIFGRKGWLLPGNVFLAMLMWPLISAGLTLQIILNWLRYSSRVLLYAPFLFVYSSAFAFGPIAYLWEEQIRSCRHPKRHMS